MWQHFGFYLPDAQYLKDPEGLIKYLVGGLHALSLFAAQQRCEMCSSWWGMPCCLTTRRALQLLTN